MKQVSLADYKRLEQKVNLLNDKMDRLMEAQAILFVKGQSSVQKEEDKKRKIRERKQEKILMRQHFERKMTQMLENLRLQNTVGRSIQKHFNLLQPPSANRIREFQKTNNPSAFDGLKRGFKERI